MKDVGKLLYPLLDISCYISQPQLDVPSSCPCYVLIPSWRETGKPKPERCQITPKVLLIFTLRDLMPGSTPTRQQPDSQIITYFYSFFSRHLAVMSI